MYFWDANEKIEFKTINGRMYLYVIHNNSHDGMCPHAHVLDISDLEFGQAYVEKNMNEFLGKAKKEGKVIKYPDY